MEIDFSQSFKSEYPEAIVSLMYSLNMAGMKNLRFHHYSTRKQSPWLVNGRKGNV